MCAPTFRSKRGCSRHLVMDGGVDGSPTCIGCPTNFDNITRMATGTIRPLESTDNITDEAIIGRPNSVHCEAAHRILLSHALMLALQRPSSGSAPTRRAWKGRTKE